MNLRGLLAHNLRRLRAEAGLSQLELAATARMSRPFLGSLERAERAATVDSIEKLASALGVKPAELLSDPQPQRSRRSDHERMLLRMGALTRKLSPARLVRFEQLATLILKDGPS